MWRQGSDGWVGAVTQGRGSGRRYIESGMAGYQWDGRL